MIPPYLADMGIPLVLARCPSMPWWDPQSTLTQALRSTFTNRPKVLEMLNYLYARAQ
jgi:hypothetical protein